MVYTCPTCGKEVERELVTFKDHTEGHIVDEIKKMHPDWKEEDGICKKCLDYFKDQMKGPS